MFFGDRTVLRTGQFEGHLLAGHHQEFIRPVVMCRFGFGQAPSLAAISQTLDKLLIYDLSQLRDRLQTMTTSTTSSQNDQLESSGSGQPKQVCYISIKEQVIETLAVASPSPGSSSLERDFLLIGCSASVMIYDTYEQAHLFSVNTSSRITSMAVASSAQSQASLLLCGGLQKLYAYQLEWRPTTGHLDVEISSERTTSEYVSCLIWGRHQSGGIGPPQQCLVTGSCEQKIRVYSIDPLEQDIQTCRLTLQETGRVTCLCAIETLQRDAHQTSSTTRQRRLSPSSSHRDDDHKAGLPSVSGQRTQDQGVAASQSREQLEMSYFAYGLENGSIGVYHLLVSQAEGAHQSAARATQLFGERLWRHKAKEMPVSLVMFDIDGDGLDELVIGFRSGRLEVRSPFTGQLLASTRCFRSSSSVHLLCLVRWPLEPVIASDGQVAATPPTDDAVGLQAKTQVGTTQQVLLACSSSSSLVAFRPQQKRPHEPLRDYLASSTGHYNAKATGESPKEDLMLTLAEEARQLGAESLLLDSGNKPANLSSSNQEDEQDLDQEQPPKATACESRQSAELMQRVGATRNKQLKLELRFKQLYQELLQRQLAASQAAQEYLAGGTTVEDRLQLAHCWDFDPSEDKLQLVLYLGGLGGCPFSGSIDMIELVDESRALIGSGHLLVSPVDVIVRSSASIGAEPQMEASGVSRIAPVASLVKLKLNSERLASLRDDSDEKVELMLSLFTSGCESKTRPNNQSQARALHQQAITLPKFGLFVPECLREPSGSKELPNNQVASRPMIRTHFSSPDGANRLQVLAWLRANFLCFQFGHFVTGTSSSEDEHSGLPIFQDHEDELLMHSNQAASHDDPMLSSFNAILREDQPAHGIDIAFVDLRPASEVDEKTEPGRLRVAMAPYHSHLRLTLESNYSDLLVELVQSLVVDRLQLDVGSHFLSSESDGPATMLQELNGIRESSRQLEESERRIQTEIYESAELIKSLMQQFNISLELNEFRTSRALLGEVSMMLNGAQNSAQAFHLNSRSRSELTRRGNRLREKVSFLQGGDMGIGAR